MPQASSYSHCPALSYTVKSKRVGYPGIWAKGQSLHYVYQTLPALSHFNSSINHHGAHICPLLVNEAHVSLNKLLESMHYIRSIYVQDVRWRVQELGSTTYWMTYASSITEVRDWDRKRQFELSKKRRIGMRKGEKRRKRASHLAN